MPQMKPMNWIMLFIIMNLIIMFMNIKNYFLKNTNFLNFKSKKLKLINKTFWKW